MFYTFVSNVINNNNFFICKHLRVAFLMVRMRGWDSSHKPKSSFFPETYFFLSISPETVIDFTQGIYLVNLNIQVIVEPLRILSYTFKKSIILNYTWAYLSLFCIHVPIGCIEMISSCMALQKYKCSKDMLLLSALPYCEEDNSKLTTIKKRT